VLRSALQKLCRFPWLSADLMKVRLFKLTGLIFIKLRSGEQSIHTKFAFSFTYCFKILQKLIHVINSPLKTFLLEHLHRIGKLFAKFYLALSILISPMPSLCILSQFAEFIYLFIKPRKQQ
jgi:hypothetical protein